MTAIHATIRTTSSFLNKKTVLLVSTAKVGEKEVPMGRWMFDVAFLMSRKDLKGTLEDRIETARNMQQAVAEQALANVLRAAAEAQIRREAQTQFAAQDGYLNTEAPAQEAQ